MYMYSWLTADNIKDYHLNGKSHVKIFNWINFFPHLIVRQKLPKAYTLVNRKKTCFMDMLRIPVCECLCVKSWEANTVVKEKLGEFSWSCIWIPCILLPRLIEVAEEWMVTGLWEGFLHTAIHWQCSLARNINQMALCGIHLQQGDGIGVAPIF